MAQAPEFNAAQMAQLDAVLEGTAEFDQEQLMRLQGQQEAPVAAPPQQSQPQAAFLLPKEVVDAYNSGAMDQAAEAELEADVAGGEVALPEGTQLARKVSPRVAQAYASGALSPEQVAELEAAISSGVARLPAGVSKPSAPATVSLAQAASAAPPQGLQAALSAAPQAPSNPTQGTVEKPSALRRAAEFIDQGADMAISMSPGGEQIQAIRKYAKEALAPRSSGEPDELEAADEEGLLARATDIFTGNLRRTERSDSAKDWTKIPGLSAYTATVASGSSPGEIAEIVKSNIPDIKVDKDEKGNYIFVSPDGGEYALKPGAQVSDLYGPAAEIAADQAVRMAAAALRIRVPPKVAGKLLTKMAREAAISAGVQTAKETAQVGEGGAFDAEEVGAAWATGGAFEGAAQLAKGALRRVTGKPHPDKPDPAFDGEIADQPLLQAMNAVARNPNTRNLKRLVANLGSLDNKGLEQVEKLKKEFGITSFDDVPIEVITKEGNVQKLFDALSQLSQHLSDRKGQFISATSEATDKTLSAIAKGDPIDAVAKASKIDRSVMQELLINGLKRTSGENAAATTKAYDDVTRRMANRGAQTTLSSTRALLRSRAIDVDGNFNIEAFKDEMRGLGELGYYIQQAEFAERGLSASGKKLAKSNNGSDKPNFINYGKIQKNLTSAKNALMDRASTNREGQANVMEVWEAIQSDLGDLFESQGVKRELYESAKKTATKEFEYDMAARRLIGDAISNPNIDAKESLGKLDLAVKRLADGQAQEFEDIIKLVPEHDRASLISASIDHAIARAAADGSPRNMDAVFTFLTRVSQNEKSERALAKYMTPDKKKMLYSIKKIAAMGAKAQDRKATSQVTYHTGSKVQASMGKLDRATYAAMSGVSKLYGYALQLAGGGIGGRAGSGFGAIIGSGATEASRNSKFGRLDQAFMMEKLSAAISTPEFMALTREFAKEQAAGRGAAAKKKLLFESTTKSERIMKDLAGTRAMKELAGAARIDPNDKEQVLRFVRLAFRSRPETEDEE